MRKIKRKLKSYPIVFLFFAFLFGFSLTDFFWPKSEYSELENRNLQQLPQFSIDAVASNEWMQDYESFVKDQFLFRDDWINLKSRSESVLLKTENNDILFGQDNYLFAKAFGIDDEDRLASNTEGLLAYAQRNPEMLEVMIVPSSAEVLEQKLPYGAPMINEFSYIDDIYAQVLATGAKVYNVYDAFIGHENDYIYYRTDHHWTYYGAYLAYEYYCEQNGLTPFDLSEHDAITVPDFYGTHYSKARNFNVESDEIVYYDLPNNLDVYTQDINGEQTAQSGALYNYDAFATRDKYAAYLRGNNAYSELAGNGKGKILVVKDSYANSFIPYLTANYETIGIVDFRLNTMVLEDITAQYGYEKVLFLYSFDAFTSDSYFAAKMAIQARS